LHAASGELNPPCVQDEKALPPLRGALRLRAVLVRFDNLFLVCVMRV